MPEDSAISIFKTFLIPWIFPAAEADSILLRLNGVYNIFEMLDNRLITALHQ